MNGGTCPNCGSIETHSVHTEYIDSETVEVVRVCNSCDAEYVNKFSLFDQEVTGGVACADCGDTIYGDRAIATNDRGEFVHRPGWGCRE